MIARRSFFHAMLAGLAGSALLAVPAQALISFGPPSALNSTAATDGDDVDSTVSLANDGAGHWVAIWSSDNDLMGTVGTDSDIFVSRSSNDGQDWTAAAAAMPDAATDGTVPDTSPRVGYGNGVFVAVFSSSNTLGGTTGGDSDILFTRSTNNGATWSAAALLNSGGTSDGALDLDIQPSIATDGAGHWVVLWKHNGLSAPTGDRVFYSYSTDDGQTWAAQQPLGNLQTFSVGNGQGTAVAWNGSSYVAVWGSSDNFAGNGNDGDLLYTLISPPGYGIGAINLLNSSATTDGTAAADQYPALTANGSTVVVAWESTGGSGGTGTDRDILFSVSSNGGSTWSAEQPLASNATVDTGDDNHVALANDGSTYIAVWDSTDRLDSPGKTKDRDILTVRSTDGATWTDVGALSTTAGKDKATDTEPAIAADPVSGAWNVAWESTDTLGGTIGEDGDLLTVHSSVDCPAMPVAAASCFEPTAPGAASMIIKEGGAKDSFQWKFARGEAVDKAMDLGDPTTSADYVLCVYDDVAGTPTLVSELDIEAGGNCFVNPCWTDVGTGYKYKHKAGLVSAATLTAGTAGTSKASVKAKAGFSAPALPLASMTTVRARLHNLSNGKCFATDFSTFTTNSPTQYKAKSD